MKHGSPTSWGGGREGSESPTSGRVGEKEVGVRQKWGGREGSESETQADKDEHNTHNLVCLCVVQEEEEKEVGEKEERKCGDWKERGREGGEEERSTLCSISSSDLICLCSSAVASRASTFTAIMILDGW